MELKNIPQVKINLDKKDLVELHLKESDLEFKIIETNFKTVRIEKFKLSIKGDSTSIIGAYNNCNEFFDRYFSILYGTDYIGHVVGNVIEKFVPNKDSPSFLSFEGSILRYS